MLTIHSKPKFATYNQIMLESNTGLAEVCERERPDVETAFVDLQLVGLVALHHHMLVLLMPLKFTSLHTTLPSLLKQGLHQQV